MDKMLRACLNWKVIAGLTAVGVGIWFVAPGLLAAALPFLLLAVCPLSMILMMKAMGSEHIAHADGTGREPVAPSPEVRLAELKATRDAIDRELRALESREPGQV